MRVVIVGAGQRRRTEASIARAARALGHPVRLVDALGWRRRLGRLAPRLIRRLVDSFEPDFVILTHHAAAAGEAAIQEMVRGRRAVFWYFDFKPTPNALMLGRVAGTMRVTYLAQLDAYRAAGIPDVGFLPQGLDPEVDKPARQFPARFRCDVSFVGSGQYPHRYDVLRAVAASCRLQIRGPGWEEAPPDLPVAGGAVYGRRFAQVIRGAAISLGADSLPEQAEDQASASNRMWKIMGCGGFYLGPFVEGIERMAQGGVHCAWYRGPSHAVELVHEFLGDPERRARVALVGRAHALAHHTYAHRVRLLLDGGAFEASDQVIPSERPR